MRWDLREHYIGLYGSPGKAIRSKMPFTEDYFVGAANAEDLLRYFENEMTPEQVLHCQAVVLKHKLMEEPI